VAEGRPAEPSLLQGIRVQYLMDCLRRSAGEESWVETDEGQSSGYRE
jgi:hypothetical protein